MCEICQFTPKFTSNLNDSFLLFLMLHYMRIPFAIQKQHIDHFIVYVQLPFHNDLIRSVCACLCVWVFFPLSFTVIIVVVVVFCCHCRLSFPKYTPNTESQFVRKENFIHKAVVWTVVCLYISMDPFPFPHFAFNSIVKCNIRTRMTERARAEWIVPKTEWGISQQLVCNKHLVIVLHRIIHGYIKF